MNRKKRGIVVMTLGSRGVLFCSHESPEVQFLPAIQNVSVVDTTGAGYFPGLFGYSIVSRGDLVYGYKVLYVS